MGRAAWQHRGRRWLYLIHRWIGIVTCLLFLVWFVSGLVMVYVPYPALTASERLAGLPPIDWGRVRIGPVEAGRLADPRTAPDSAVLEMLAAEPVWRITPPGKEVVTVSAQIGEVRGPADADTARRVAEAFGRRAVIDVERLQRDQWTVAGGFDRHRPLYRVRLDGADRRDLYVSGTTGAVVQETTARERFWNWLGSVPHWIYPTLLRQDSGAWRQVVLWISGPCILVAVTGIWIGLLRTRLGERRFPAGRMTPYHGWMLWHHVAGLAGGLTLLLWIFSGWLSVDPGHLFRSVGLDPAAEAAYVRAGRPPSIDAAALAEAAGANVKRVTLRWAAGRPWLVVERPAAAVVLDARTLTPASARRTALIAAVGSLLPGERILSVQQLTAADLYWYQVGAPPRLPVLRVKFGDDAGTWVHVDPVTGDLLGKLDRRGRIYRWLFDLFHKWDLNVLTGNRPAWDGVLWLLSLAGIVISISGIRAGWRRLRLSSGRSSATGSGTRRA